MRFSDIYGLNEIKQRLIDSVKNSHVAHGQMFLGREGTASLALALAFATYINCEDKQDNDSCGRCASCVKADKLVHPDFHFVYPVFSIPKKDEDTIRGEVLSAWRDTMNTNPYLNLSDWAEKIDAKNKQCIISVDEGRGIIKYLALKSFEAEYKVVFIWLPELMNQSAANAILKILEEPPEKTLFMLVSQDAEKNLATILSRTQILKIPPYQEGDIESYLVDRKGLDAERAKKCAYLADGDLNKALKLTDEVENDFQDYFRDWMRLCYTANFKEISDLSEEFQKTSKDRQKGLMQFSMNVFRELLIFHSGTEDLFKVSDTTKAFLEGFAKVVNAEKISSLVSKVNEAVFHIERNASPKMTFFDLSISISKILKAKS